MWRKSWKDLSVGQRVAVGLLGVLQVSLLVAALLDIRHRDQAELRGSKSLWTAAAFVNWIGPLAYFAFGRKRG